MVVVSDAPIPVPTKRRPQLPWRMIAEAKEDSRRMLPIRGNRAGTRMIPDWIGWRRASLGLSTRIEPKEALPSIRFLNEKRPHPSAEDR